MSKAFERRALLGGLGAGICCLYGLGADKAWAEAADLTIWAVGFLHARGHATAKLFMPGDNVLGPGRWETAAPIEKGTARFTFKALPPGDYAVVVFHDENDNGRIDHTAVGLPAEPLGFSNGFRLGLISGRPSFENLRFEHGPGPTHLSISLR